MQPYQQKGCTNNPPGKFFYKWWGWCIPEFELNKIYVTLWLEDKLLTWYLGCCISKNDDNRYRIEHLEQVKKSSNLKCKNPRVPDTAYYGTKHIWMQYWGRLGLFEMISYFYPEKSQTNRKFCKNLIYQIELHPSSDILKLAF